MVYAAVLAGGSGLRMGGRLPKQFLTVCGRPIIIRSIEAFAESGMVDRIYVSVSQDYIEYTSELINKYCGKLAVQTVVGGANRNETLFNVLKKINEDNKINDEDVILTHDAVRPFIDNRIISENIAAAGKYGACNTVVPAVDTILVSDGGMFIDEVPPRSSIFHAQTPQSFNVKKLYELYMGMTAKQLEEYTDACTVFIQKGEKVFMVPGDRNNIKLTYPEDMEKAESIIKCRERNK